MAQVDYIVVQVKEFYCENSYEDVRQSIPMDTKWKTTDNPKEISDKISIINRYAYKIGLENQLQIIWKPSDVTVDDLFEKANVHFMKDEAKKQKEAEQRKKAAEKRAVTIAKNKKEKLLKQLAELEGKTE